MPTAIAVTDPDLVLTSPDRHTPTASVLPVGEAQERYPLDRAIIDVHTLIEQHGYVIVLCPQSAPDTVLHRLHAIRSVLESDRIAILRPELPPLGLAVLALQLRQLSICDFSPGVLASAARLLAHYVYAGAVVGSVAKLDRVPVTLRAHAKSWSPNAQFAVVASPQPELVRLTGAAGEAPGGPSFGTHLFYATGQSAADWVTGELARAWRVHGVTEARLPAESARWWATGKPGSPGRIVEFAAAIPDISVLYQLVSSVRREDCRWCGLELIGDRCGFCAAPLSDGAPPERVGGGRQTAALRPAAASARAALPRGPH
ncbi:MULTISPECIES: hypothetical protein [unclassified Streptomyces]|uniref:hypothetical protein n=1 Tax=unclassified Streptomyces TaxID=2593676 RepID=UPI000DC412ED|nr:hypothetical protein [Streptomyces sp. PsTaAH-137]RAJ86484.1 hypothetical protein K377_03332 [Streptomyces sp. PsTaAH-137]